MNGFDEIISKIISDAQTQADSITQESEQRIEKLRSEAKQRAEHRAKDYSKQLALYRTETLRRRKTVSQLDLKKEMLGKKKDLIDLVYQNTLNALIALPDEKYLSLIGQLIENNASDNDEVVICRADEKRITSTFIQSIAKKKKISLTLSDKFGDFSGGIILSSKHIDKNLTFDSELRELADQKEAAIFNILFGE